MPLTPPLRKCRVCGVEATNERDLDLFTKSKTGLHGRANRCKGCTSDSMVAYRAAAYMERIDALKAAPCADCGGQFPPVCMDFDHVRGEKVNAVSYMTRRFVPWELVEQEIAKCDLVCANCHRIRTATRNGGRWGKRVTFES